MSKRKLASTGWGAGAYEEFSGPWHTMPPDQQLRRAVDLDARWRELAAPDRNRQVMSIKAEWGRLPPAVQHRLAAVGNGAFSELWLDVAKGVSRARLSAMPQVVLPGLSTTPPVLDTSSPTVTANPEALVDRGQLAAAISTAAGDHGVAVAPSAVDALGHGIAAWVHAEIHHSHFVAAKRWGADTDTLGLRPAHLTSTAAAGWGAADTAGGRRRIADAHPGLAALLACAAGWCGGGATPGLRRISELCADGKNTAEEVTPDTRAPEWAQGGLWGVVDGGAARCPGTGTGRRAIEAAAYLVRVSASPEREAPWAGAGGGGGNDAAVAGAVATGAAADGGMPGGLVLPSPPRAEGGGDAAEAGGGGEADAVLPCDDEHLQQYLKCQTRAAMWRSDAMEDLFMDSASRDVRTVARSQQFLEAVEDLAHDARDAETTLQDPEHTEPTRLADPRAHPIWTYVYPVYAQLKIAEEEAQLAAEESARRRAKEAAVKSAEAQRQSRTQQLTTRAALGVRRGVVLRGVKAITAADIQKGRLLLPPPGSARTACV